MVLQSSEDSRRGPFNSRSVKIKKKYEDWKGLKELNTKVYLCIRGLIQFADECWRG